MKTVKTSELTGAALDWAVAQCELMRNDCRDHGLLVHRIGYGQPMPPYSTDWVQGGSIIEREFIETTVTACGYTGKVRDTWTAFKGVPDADGIETYGPTPLVAAMRCYIASKMGDTFEVPDGLD